MRLDKPKGINVQITERSNNIIEVQVYDKKIKSNSFTVYDTTVDKLSLFFRKAIADDIMRRRGGD